LEEYPVSDQVISYLYTEPSFAFQEGETPLHIAIFLGYTNIAELLLKAKADVNKRDKVCWNIQLNKSYCLRLNVVGRLMLKFNEKEVLVSDLHLAFPSLTSWSPKQSRFPIYYLMHEFGRLRF
jgi:ankyrin repeat protein